MPPSEGLKLLISELQTGRELDKAQRSMAVFDVKRAHLYGRAKRNVVLRLPS